LAVNGNDIVKLLWKPGPKVGEILNQLLEFVLEDETRNQKDLLLQKARELFFTL
jgi:tRNA nucleotidyltransferase (CCA-adding enzyme)